jgi:tyrosyl-tRNA synthetase
MEEVQAVADLQGTDLNLVKTILAYEVTRITHGEAAARAAQAESEEIFGARTITDDLLPSSEVRRQPESAAEGAAAGMPATTIASSRLRQGIPAFELFAEVGLCSSRGEARRLIKQGGGYINGRRIETFDERATLDQLEKGEILLRAGKKKYHRIQVDEKT